VVQSRTGLLSVHRLDPNKRTQSVFTGRFLIVHHSIKRESLNIFCHRCGSVIPCYGSTGCVQVSIKGSAGDAEGLADIRDAVVFVVVERTSHCQLAWCPQLLRPAPLPPPCSCRRQPCLGALADQVTLELSKGAKNVEDQFASRCRGINRKRQRGAWRYRLRSEEMGRCRCCLACRDRLWHRGQRGRG